MAPAKPTILIIHGAWHRPTHYSKLQAHLEGRGYPVVAPRLPTCNNDVPPTSTTEDDVALIRKIATELISEGKKIIALMHSYGCIVGTSALAGLALNSNSLDSKGGVTALIYMTAFVPHENQSLADMFADTGLPPWLQPNAETGLLEVDDPGYHFYTDLSAEEQEIWVKELVVHPIAAQVASIGDECAWRDELGVWYLVCEGDAALPPAVQDGMVEGIRKEGVEVKVERCSAGHSPFLSMVERVGELIEKAAAGK